ncbi:MAG: MBL fold metallo-hydrolase [Actinomycetia bacterium]|nr:MBL fold metallo-hydrolase [Actinomycetes bacterium]
MVKVHLLGTGTPILDASRCGSGTAISTPDGWVLVDCGRGVTQRVAQAGLELDRLLAVLLTHHHSDHVSDLSTLAIARWSESSVNEPLVVVAPEGPCARFARDCLLAFADPAFYAQADPGAGARPAIDARSFDATDEPSNTAVIGPFDVSSVLVAHHPIEAAVGYRVEIGSTSVVISGDTAACSGIEELASGTDLLIHEALLGGSVRPQLLEWNASAESVGALADRADAKRLVLSHLLPPPNDCESEEQFAADARSGGYLGPIEVARDLMTIELAHH